MQKTGRLVVVDEACQTCGAAAEIVALVTADKAAFARLKAAPARVCGLDVPIPFSPPMEKYAIPDKARHRGGGPGCDEALAAAWRGGISLNPRNSESILALLQRESTISS